MVKIQPFTHAEKGEVSTHVITTSVPEIYDALSRKLEDVNEKAGQPGFKLAKGVIHEVEISVALRPVGPSALAILVEELSRLGARVIVNIDTALALMPSLDVGRVFLASAAIKGDGVSRNYLPVEIPAIADYSLLRHIQQTFEIHNIKTVNGIVWSLDTYYISDILLEKGVRVYGKYAHALDMDTAALYTVAIARKLRGASILIIEANAVKGMERGAFMLDEAEELRNRVLDTINKVTKPLVEAMALHIEKTKTKAIINNNNY